MKIKNERQAEVHEGFQRNFLHNVEESDEVVNNQIIQQDLGVSAAKLAHKRGISFSEAIKAVSEYYFQ